MLIGARFVKPVFKDLSRADNKYLARGVELAARGVVLAKWQRTMHVMRILLLQQTEVSLGRAGRGDNLPDQHDLHIIGEWRVSNGV